MDHNLTSLFALNIKPDRDDQTIPKSNDAVLLLLLHTNTSSWGNNTELTTQFTIGML